VVVGRGPAGSSYMGIRPCNTGGTTYLNAANADVLSRREVANLTGHEYQPPGIMSW
jgi:hypothetical protein